MICFIFISCQNKENKKVKADLTFRSVSFASAYGASDEEYNNLLRYINKSISENNSNDDSKKLYQHFRKLKKLNLLKSPYIFLNLGGDSIMTVYLSENEYNKVKSFRQVDLFKEHKKIVLELDIEKKDIGIYYSNNIIKISKVEGKSRSNI